MLGFRKIAVQFHTLEEGPAACFGTGGKTGAGMKA
jgi:hypothetical protein